MAGRALLVHEIYHKAHLQVKPRVVGEGSVRFLPPALPCKGNGSLPAVLECRGQPMSVSTEGVETQRSVPERAVSEDGAGEGNATLWSGSWLE